jgi:integrase/recombinase XerD
MSLEMHLRGFTSDTKRHYHYYVHRFSGLFDQSPEILDESHVRTFIHHLITKEYSFSLINTTYSVIKFLYVQVFRRSWNVKNIPRPKKVAKLPRYLSTEEVMQFCFL